MLRGAAKNEQVGERVDDIDGVQLPIDANGQASMRELADDIQHTILPSVMRAILDEVIGPDMIAALRPQPDA